MLYNEYGCKGVDLELSRVKSSINYPINLHKILKKIHENDMTGRTFNQIVLDLLFSTNEVKEELEKMKNNN